MFDAELYIPYNDETPAGNYLAGQFAQRHHDWESASRFMKTVLAADQDDPSLLSRTMILSMGAEKYEDAISYAHKVKALENDNTLATLILATEAFKKQDYAQAAQLVQTMSEGSLSEFMMPLIEGWSKAGVGEYGIDELASNTIHLHHAILIATFLDQQNDIETLLQRSLGAQGLTLNDVEQIADVYAHIGKKDMALDLYDKILEEWPENKAVNEKTFALKNDQPITFFRGVKTAEQGVAQALYDMALLLFHEYSDDSARVFASMAFYLNPDLSDVTLLMAHLNARNDRTDEAIALYNSIPPQNEHFLESRRLAASMLEDADRDKEALSVLEGLYQNYQDVDSLIQIGDLYRRNEEFEKAIASYNKAENALGGINKDYWHLLYVRGMSYEQNNQWLKAEQDLKGALDYQPDHPLVLNYLGYAWADQGVNLDQSLELIRKAATLENDDGYIIDSLGWVLYRMGSYEEAVPHLERAVELLPYDPIINDHLGDAYWRVGRKLEARFQWQRARNHSEEEALSDVIAQKLETGLKPVKAINIDIAKENSAHTGTPEPLNP